MSNPYFNAAYYLRNNPDVLAAGYTQATAEQHYLQYGANEAFTAHRNGVDLGSARKPAPWFDIGDYLDHYPDLIDNGVVPATAFQHFTTYGIVEGRSPSPLFSLDAENLGAYAAGNPDLMAAFGIDDPDTLSPEQIIALSHHYYQYGYKEDRPDLPGVADRFTTDIDDLKGTRYNDTFIADTENSVQTGDTLDGGGGYNVLKIAPGAIVSAAAPTISHVQKIVNADLDLKGLNADKAFDLRNIRGLEVLETDFSGMPADADMAVVAYANATASTIFGIADAGSHLAPDPNIASLFVHYANDQDPDTFKLALTGNAHDSLAVVVAVQGDLTDNVDIVDNIEIALGKDNGGTLALPPVTKTITMTGEGSLALQNENFSQLVSIDASTVSGNIALGGADRDVSHDQDRELGLGQNFVIKTGAGDDIIDLSTVTTTGYVHAGAGNDTLVVDYNHDVTHDPENTNGADFANAADAPDRPDAIWTLAGGDGNDTFKIAGFNIYHDDEGFDADTGAIITDFNGTDDTLLLNFGKGPTVFVDQAVVDRVVLNSSDIDEALNKLLGQEHDNAFINGANVAVLEMDNKTYAIYEVGESDHGVIELLGTGLGLDETSVVGF